MFLHMKAATEEAVGAVRVVVACSADTTADAAAVETDTTRRRRTSSAVRQSRQTDQHRNPIRRRRASWAVDDHRWDVDCASAVCVELGQERKIGQTLSPVHRMVTRLVYSVCTIGARFGLRRRSVAASALDSGLE